jgi:hypothetical protein
LADWRDAAAYERNRDDWTWRWEFLRRRVDYRRAWDAAGQDPLHTDPRRRRTPQWQERERFGTNFLWDPTDPWDPPKGWRTGAGKSWDHHPNAAARGLFSSRHPSRIVLTTTAECREFERNGIALVAFDLKLPLKSQLTAVGAALAQEQTERFAVRSNRQHRVLWNAYLRMLDAKADGATLEDAHRVIVGGRNPGSDERIKRAAEMLQAADDVCRQLTGKTSGLRTATKSDTQ